MKIANAMARGAHAWKFADAKHVRRSYIKDVLQRLSKKERRVDALALRAEERRDKLRKAAGRCK